MGKVMVTIQSEQPPSLAEIREKFGLSENEVDSQFGVVELDPEDHLYSIMVDENKAKGITGLDEKLQGPFSNPRIVPFGPPQA